VAAEIEFGLLGPLTVRAGGVAVTVPRGKQRVILALLLLNAGQIVRLDEFTETLWVSGPPPSGPVAVQNYVMRLRNTLGDAGRDRIITQPRGYLIRVAANELDLSRFEALLGAARTAARDGSWDQAATHAGAAVELWRGEPLADVDSETLSAREVPRLAELRLQAQETRIDADLHLGRHTDVIPELRQLTGAHPLRERLYAQLMLAFYRDSRQAEALAAYQAAREILVAELGTEPGTGLRRLHQQILTGDPAVAASESAQPVTGSEGSAVPRELPAQVRHFTGRAGELAALTGMLDQAGDETPGTLVITAIGGTAGVGKTALAVHWAHQVADRFPGGQLYVNLRGYDPGQPASATDALAGFLRSLGVPGHDIPPEEEQRAARYRSLLVGKQMLIVLDNAGSADQVRPLLPGTPTCTVVVTSRDALAGLVARDGATRLDLDVLPLEEAIALLRTLIGARVDAESEAAAELAGQCSRLPLALRVAAELASSRTAVPLATLTAELSDQQKRLDILEAGGDPRTAVRAVLSWSYRHLGADATRAFRLAGLHPGPDLDPYAAAALTSTTLDHACRLLDQLASANLLQRIAPWRYGMHDLLRAYACELSADQDGGQERRAALTRLFDYYLHTAATSMDTLFPGERNRRPRIPGQPHPAPSLTDPAAARDWLDCERTTLVAVAMHAAEHDWPVQAIQLATTLFRYLDDGGYYSEAVTVHTCAQHSAHDTGDRAAEAIALTSLGLVEGQQDRYRQAADHQRQALTLFCEINDQAGQARALHNLGLVELWQNQYKQAIEHFQRALTLFRRLGIRGGEARTLGNLGHTSLLLGRYQEAADLQRKALALCCQICDRSGEATALSRLGAVELRLGRYQQATEHIQQAQALFRDISEPAGEATATNRLGVVELRLGRYQQATGHFEQGRDLCHKIGNRSGEAEALNGLGDVLFRIGEPDKAHEHHATALRLASEVGASREQAHAHTGLARAYRAAGDVPQAQHHLQDALTLYAAIGAPEADEIRAQLGRVDGGDDKPAEADGGTTTPCPR